MPFDPSNDYTPYSNIDSGANNTTAGIIEIAEGDHVVGFRYLKEVLATGLPTITQTIRDDWIIEVCETNQPGARVLFRQRVNFGVNVVAVSGLFIAYPADNEQIETTNINGEEISPGDAAQFLDLGYQSEFGITADFVGTLGGDGYGIAQGTWMSLPYRVELPQGAYFRIVHDGWRPIGLSRIATYRTSYKSGAARISSLIDGVGALRVASGRGARVLITHVYSRPGFTYPRRRARVQGAQQTALREPSITKDGSNRMWLSAFEGSIYRLFYSDDDGRFFSPFELRTPTGETMPVAIWQNGETYTDRIQTADGTHVVIAQRGSLILIKTSADGLLWSGARRVAYRKRAEQYTISENILTGELVVSNGRLDHILLSVDRGRKFTDITPKAPGEN